MSAGRKPPLDPAPLLVRAGDGSSRELATRLGVAARTVARWRSGTVTLWPTDADRFAVRLGLHPCEVWGDDPFGTPNTLQADPNGRRMTVDEYELREAAYEATTEVAAR